MDFKAVIFDFDGVLAESNAVKDQAFSELFSEFPEHETRMAQYHRDNLQVSRVIKFQYYTEKLFGIELHSEKGKVLMDELGQKFSKLVMSGVIAADSIAGTEELLEYLKSRQVPLYIASMTPHTELQQIVKARGLSDYFTGIYGNPPHSKRAVIQRIRQDLLLENRDMLFIGDSIADYEAAHAEEISFIGRKSDHYFSSPEAAWYNDHHEIKNSLMGNAN